MLVLHLSDAPCPNFAELYNRCDVLLFTGDLNWDDFALLRSGGPPRNQAAFGVYGDQDPPDALERLGIENLHNRTVTLDGLIFGGFQGCLRYNDGPFQYTEAEAQQWAAQFPPVDVLLLHAPPQGLLDGSDTGAPGGSPSVLAHINRHKPQRVFMGHLRTTADLGYGPRRRPLRYAYGGWVSWIGDTDTKLHRTQGARWLWIGDPDFAVDESG